MVRKIFAFFKSARCSHHLMNPTLVEILAEKLNPSTQHDWRQLVVKIVPFPTEDNFGDWLRVIACSSVLSGTSDLSLVHSQTLKMVFRQTKSSLFWMLT